MYGLFVQHVIVCLPRRIITFNSDICTDMNNWVSVLLSLAEPYENRSKWNPDDLIKAKPFGGKIIRGFFFQSPGNLALQLIQANVVTLILLEKLKYSSPSEMFHYFHFLTYFVSHFRYYRDIARLPRDKCDGRSYRKQ